MARASTSTDLAPPRIRIGVSACLLGQKVRFDGQHKRDAFLMDELGPFVEWVPVCPELEVGMGVPREPVRLVRKRDRLQMLGVDSGDDWTARMNAFAAARANALRAEELAGFVLKAKSPSCGMERVKVYDSPDADGRAAPRGVGLFAAALARRLPNLPMEEEGRLCHARLREGFIERVFAYAAIRALWRTPWKVGDLVAFHTAHEMALLAHSTEGYRTLGRLVARARTLPRAELRDRYETAFMAVLASPTTRRRTRAISTVRSYWLQLRNPT